MRDKRDLRDPQKLGESLIADARSARDAYATPEHPIPLSEVYDIHTGHLEHPNYPQDESMAVVTAREYRAELEARTDKYAKSALARIDKGERVEYDDPAGN